MSNLSLLPNIDSWTNDSQSTNDLDSMDYDTILQMMTDLDSPMTKATTSSPIIQTVRIGKSPTEHRRAKSSKLSRKSKWRKYGQKKVMIDQPSSKEKCCTAKVQVVRSYYKCSTTNCECKKTVDYLNGMEIQNEYKQKHSEMCDNARDHYHSKVVDNAARDHCHSKVVDNENNLLVPPCLARSTDAFYESRPPY